jgi:8-oxo-dGTP pyrophosphatase MutT (NUDIX family)
MDALQKVTAFVVTAASPRHLLVFQHPLAGLQLPAGTVEPDEPPAEAAAREVGEETGIRVDEGEQLDDERRRLGGDRAAMLRTVTVGDETLRRGHPVRILDTSDPQAVAIRREIYDYEVSPPQLIESTDAEVPADAVTRQLHRWFYCFVVDAETHERWTREADGHEFEVHWTPLRRDVPLVDEQSRWLKRRFEAIEASLG